MIRYIGIEVSTYRQYKEQLNAALTRTADGMVNVGYLLMQARDTDILRESGYSGMGEFAMKEYGLTPDQTSRFIAIAERFGDGEGQLKDEWQQYGYTKLSEMLTLPTAVIEAIPPEVTREEIRELKAEVKAEEAITPIEVALEDKTEGEHSELYLFLVEYFRAEEHAEEFVRAISVNWDTLWGEEEDKKAVLDGLAPSGIGILEARVPGRGRFMLSFKGENVLPTYVDIRNNTSRDVQWEEVRDAIEELDGGDMTASTGDDIKHLWEKLYEREFPAAKPSVSDKPEKNDKPEKKVKIAPAQKKEKKPEKKAETETVPKGSVATEAEKEEPREAAPTACQPAEVWKDDAINRPEIKRYDKQALIRAANGLRAMADEFERGDAGDIYSVPIEKLERIVDEINSLPGELLPIIESAIAIKKAETIKEGDNE